jgi:hypothetical protein
MNTIVAIDPGQTTGVCAIREAHKSDDFQVVGTWQIPWEDRVTFFVALFSGTFALGKSKSLLPEVVVIENFHLRPGRALEQIGSEFPSVRVIGIVEVLVALCCPKPLLIFQDPSVIGRVSILPEHEERLAGLIHAQDAYRHARYYHITTRR